MEPMQEGDTASEGEDEVSEDMVLQEGTQQKRRFSVAFGKRVMKGVKGVKSAARRMTISSGAKTPLKAPRDRRRSVVSQPVLRIPHIVW